MNDCIERKKAIELIQLHVKPQIVYGEGYLQAIEHATDILELLPAADVQPVVHAVWICHEPEIGLYYSCSRCGHNTLQGMYKFCPNCGAKMDESEDDKHE